MYDLRRLKSWSYTQMNSCIRQDIDLFGFEFVHVRWNIQNVVMAQIVDFFVRDCEVLGVTL
jgi:hypothetical protein